MDCPKCGFVQLDDHPECLRCGVIFRKIRPSVEQNEGAAPAEGEITVAEHDGVTLKNIILPEPPASEPLFVAGRGLILLVLAIWSVFFFFSSIKANDAGNSILHLVNLPFHEAGHIIFSFFGRFIQVLGGTLGQLLMPTICMAVFLFRNRDAFASAVALWWLAENFMDIAPYVNDARSLDLVLLGGVTGKEVADYHDWEYILRTLGLLKADHLLAGLAHGLGILLMLTALVWAAVNLWRQIRLEKSEGS